MSLHLTLAHPEYTFNHEDLEMARECGLLTPVSQDTMATEGPMATEEELQEEEQFLQELERASYPFLLPAEVLELGRVYNGYEVRVTHINRGEKPSGFAKIVTDTPIGDMASVYIPPNLVKKFSIIEGESLRMNLLFSCANKKNPWKAVYIWNKEKPQISSEIEHQTDVEENYTRKQINFTIPRVDIGKTVGKSGWRVNKAIKHYAPQYKNYDNESLSEEIAFNFTNIDGFEDITLVEAYFKDYSGETSQKQTVIKALNFLYV
jgi:hypothetical protein